MGKIVKRIQRGYTPEKELSHDVLRRMRLMANSSTLKLETDAIKNVVDFMINILVVMS